MKMLQKLLSAGDLYFPDLLIFVSSTSQAFQSTLLDTMKLSFGKAAVLAANTSQVLAATSRCFPGT